MTGAGDTVLATLSAVLASGMSLDQAAELCNVAASLAIEQVGCARITLADMSQRLLDEHAEHKIIHASFAPALHYALKDRPHTILELTDASTLDPDLFAKIQSLKAITPHTLVMSIPGLPLSPKPQPHPHAHFSSRSGFCFRALVFLYKNSFWVMSWGLG